MHEDNEVLSFCFRSAKYPVDRIKIIKFLDHPELSPLTISIDRSIEDNSRILFDFFNRRVIPHTREDIDEILKATNCKDSLELSFKGHGLSLQNHYWYKKEGENLKFSEINFFTNKWDDSFAKAILNEDYEALAKADLNVPDIVTPGWGVKGWIYDNEPKLYKRGIDKTHPEEVLAEVLASRLVARLFKEEEALHYELKKINGNYVSVSPLMINVDEELTPLSKVLPFKLYSLFRDRNVNKEFDKEFFEKIKEYKAANFYEFFVKLSCLRTLCFVSDLHFDNISVIKNLKTGELRIAPVYDLGGAFGSSKSGRKFITDFNQGSLIIIYFLFSNIRPEWDYSWYDPNRLVGFEDEIKEILSKSEFYTPEIIENIITIYHQQKDCLDKMALESKNNQNTAK